MKNKSIKILGCILSLSFILSGCNGSTNTDKENSQTELLNGKAENAIYGVLENSEETESLEEVVENTQIIETELESEIIQVTTNETVEKSDSKTESNKTTITESNKNNESNNVAPNANKGDSNSNKHEHKWVAVTKTVQHDAEYKTVSHPAEYKTVHHEAETKVVHREAQYKTIHHEAEYKTVNHPAEYKTERVCVDPGWTEEVTVRGSFCEGCGELLDEGARKAGMEINDYARKHMGAHRQNDGRSYSHIYTERVVDTIEHPAVYEEKQILVKDAYTEKVLVKEAYDEKVLVKDAYTETVTTGYKCSCGATK